MATSETPTLETRHLTHVFPDGTVAIEDVTLTICSGEFIIIAGANGSGKTVLAKHFNGLLAPSKGQVFIDGKPVAKNILYARRHVGLVFQNSDNQIVGQTVAEDVAFGPENLSLAPEEAEEVVKASLETVGLTPLAMQNPHVLSGGQKRKLTIAGVLAMKPRIIILDEPFTGLDYPGVVQILTQILLLHQTGHGIILITHELEKVLAHADRLILMAAGRVVEDGCPEEVIIRLEKYGVRMPLRRYDGIESLTWLR